jgi:DNA modification methylase
MSIQILMGDVRERLKDLADESLHCIVTSPPYFGLRDYGMDGQIGLEETPEEYVQELVEVFRSARRVLRDDGTLWLNLGDSYGKGKQLLGIPWRVALALQADGWVLRSSIIWHKPNPMPEGTARDRPTRAFEDMFLLAKSPRYYYDAAAVEERAAQPIGKPKLTGQHKADANGFTMNGKSNSSLGSNQGRPLRNLRNVWTIPPRPFKGAHFAVFPPALVEPCIKAGCPEGGTVLDPFGGSGTTGLVAHQHGRNAILIELNPGYANIAMERLPREAVHLQIPPKEEP